MWFKIIKNVIGAVITWHVVGWAYDITVGDYKREKEELKRGKKILKSIKKKEKRGKHAIQGDDRQNH